MTLEIVRIRRNDSLDAILHKVGQTTESHVLLVLPPRAERQLAEQVDMARLKQAARERGCIIGVVAIDRRVHTSGAAVDIPTYSFLWMARRRILRQRAWWKPEKPDRPGKPTNLSQADREAIHRRIVPMPRWLSYSWRYLVIILFCFTLAVLAVGAYYSVPRATITLKPDLRPLRVRQEIVADPRFNEDEASGATVPGRLLFAVNKIQSGAATTGVREVPIAPARGTVTFVNRIPQAVTVPAGTRVSTSTGERIIFQTLADIQIPARVGGEADVEVVALESGPRGNLPADRVNRIEGVLSTQLNVRNLWAISGGSVEYRNAVSVQDRDRLREHVLETIFELSKAQMEEELEDVEFLSEDSIRVVAIYDETYSHFVGEATDELKMEIRAELHGTAVNEEVAFELLMSELETQIPLNYTVLPDSIEQRVGELLGVDAEGRVSLELVAQAMTVAELELIDPIEQITGQEIDQARRYLNNNLPLRELPNVSVWPQRFERMPYLPARIFTTVDTDN